MSRCFGIIDQAPSDASFRSCSQEIPLIVQKYEGSLSHSQQLVTCRCHEPDVYGLRLILPHQDSF